MSKQTVRDKSKQRTKAASTPDTSKSKFSLPPGVLQGVAFTMIGIAVVLSWFLTPVPVACGITILAVVRIIIAIRESRRQTSEPDADNGSGTNAICPARR